MKYSQSSSNFRAQNRLCFLAGGWRGFVACLAASISFCAMTRAADIVWTNTAGGNWNVAANWNPNQAPSTNDTA
jgi:hypothetical protein